MEKYSSKIYLELKWYSFFEVTTQMKINLSSKVPQDTNLPSSWNIYQIHINQNKE